jgi:hypothetical protein
MFNAPTNTTTPAIAILAGTELRRIVAAEPTASHAAALRRIGNLDVQLVRRDGKWTLYLADLTPIPHGTRDLWATAVSAPSVEWSQTPDGCSAWCEWTVSGPVRG